MAEDYDERPPLGEGLAGVDESVRPRSLEEFIGQDELRANLRVYLDAARGRGKALDHTLFYGNPGLGKTTLAQIMAAELGVNLVCTSGPVLERSGDLAAILTNLGRHDILFVDEIHRMPIAVEEVLYPAMEDFKLDLVIGQGPAARTVKIDLSLLPWWGPPPEWGLFPPPCVTASALWRGCSTTAPTTWPAWWGVRPVFWVWR